MNTTERSKRTLRDALAVAVGEKVADQLLRHARTQVERAGRRELGHLAGYGSLLTVIWIQRRSHRKAIR